MLKRSILIGLFLFLAGALVAACDNREPVGVPPTAEPPAAATGTATATAVAVAVVSPSPSLTATLELTTTATVTATLPPEVAVLQAVNIRSGPGTDYPIVGYVAGDNWLVTGRSADGLWWRIQCPEGTPSDECWITASETAVAPAGTVEAPLAAAPPLPTATPAPTATPCVVGSRSGWTTYQVVAGDTLSSIAARFGGSAGQIAAANCLASDAIVAGSSLWVPAGGTASSGAGPALPETTVAPIAGNTSAATPGLVLATTPLAQQAGHSIPPGIEGVLPFVPPNETICPEPGAAGIVPLPSVFIGRNDQEAKSIWAVAEDVCIYLPGFDPSKPITITVTLPDAVGSIRTPFIFQPDGAIWASFVPLPGDPVGPDQSYIVEARQAGARPTATFQVLRSVTERINVVDPVYRVGDTVKVALAGIAGGRWLYLYRLEGDGDTPEWRPTNHAIPMAFGDRDREALVEFSTVGLEPGTYLVHTGAPRSFYYGDPEVFFLNP